MPAAPVIDGLHSSVRQLQSLFLLVPFNRFDIWTWRIPANSQQIIPDYEIIGWRWVMVVQFTIIFLEQRKNCSRIIQRLNCLSMQVLVGIPVLAGTKNCYNDSLQQYSRLEMGNDFFRCISFSMFLLEYRRCRIKVWN